MCSIAKLAAFLVPQTCLLNLNRWL